MLELRWNAPISDAKMCDVFAALALPSGQTVLDVGCGCGEVAIRLHERFAVRGVGVDVSAEFIDEANRRAVGRVRGDAIRFVHFDARDFETEIGSVDLGVCMGATHAFGTGADAYRSTLERLCRWVRPGGRLLVGEGYMKQPAAAEYRKVLGDFPPDAMTHAANVATAKAMGLIPLGAWTSSVDEWDEFEWTYQRIVERRAAERPDDDDEAVARLKRRRGWMDAFLRWGRETLGYGVYLFERPRDHARTRLM